jgi:hypothetical protein
MSAAFDPSRDSMPPSSNSELSDFDYSTRAIVSFWFAVPFCFSVDSTRLSIALSL